MKKPRELPDIQEFLNYLEVNLPLAPRRKQEPIKPKAITIVDTRPSPLQHNFSSNQR